MSKLTLLQSFPSFQLNLSIELPKKGIIVLEGTSGCGKSTTLNLLSGKIKNEAESFCPLDCYHMESKSFLLPNKKVSDILAIVENENQKEITKTILQMLNLETHLQQKIKNLSEGEKKLVDFVLAILSNKSIILMDEPHAMIHENIIKKQIQIIQNLAKDKLFIIATHKIQYYQEIANTIYSLQEGKIVSIFNNQQPKSFSLIPTFKTTPLKKPKKWLKFQFHASVFIFAFCVLLIFCIGLSFLSYNQTIINATTQEDLNRYELGLFEYDHQAQFQFQTKVTNQQKNQLVQEIANQKNLETDYLITLHQYFLVGIRGEINQTYTFTSSYDFHYFFNEEPKNIIGKQETAENEIYVSSLFMDKFAYFFPSYQKDQIENFLATQPQIIFYTNDNLISYQIVGIIPSTDSFVSHSFLSSEEFFQSWFNDYEITEDENIVAEDEKIIFLKQYYFKNMTLDQLTNLQSQYPNYDFTLSNQKGFVTLKERISLQEFDQKINQANYILAYHQASVNQHIPFLNDTIYDHFLYVMKNENFFYDKYTFIGSKKPLNDNEIYISEGFYLRYLKNKKANEYLEQFITLSTKEYKIKGILTSFYKEAIFFNAAGYQNLFDASFLVNNFNLYLEDMTQLNTYQEDLQSQFPLYHLSKYEDAYISQKINEIVYNIQTIKNEQHQQQKVYQYLMIFFFVLTFILFYFQMRMSKKYYLFYQKQQIQMNQIKITYFMVSLFFILIVYVVCKDIFENILIRQFYQQLLKFIDGRPEFRFQNTYHLSWLIFLGVILIQIIQYIPWWRIKNEILRKRNRKIS